MPVNDTAGTLEKAGATADGSDGPTPAAVGMRGSGFPADTRGDIRAPWVKKGREDPILPAELLDRAHLTNPWIALSIGVLMMGVQVLAVYADGYGFLAGTFDFWQHGIEVPLLTFYLLLMHRFLDEYGRRVVLSTRRIADVDDFTFNSLASSTWTRINRYQPVVMALSLVISALLQQMWDWLPVWYWGLLGGRVNALFEHMLIGSLIYIALARNRLFTRLYRLPIRIDLFNLAPVRPLAQWGLGLAVAVTGGVTISVVLVGDPESLLDSSHLPLYTLALASAVLLFFGSMSSAHHVLIQAKASELQIVHEGLSSAYNALRESQPSGDAAVSGAHAESVQAWLAYEKRIIDVPEWPYTANTLRGLYVSVLLPILLMVLQQLVIRIWPP